MKGITMSVFTPIKKIEEVKVHHSEYLRTANASDEAGETPVAPDTKPAEPETK